MKTIAGSLAKIGVVAVVLTFVCRLPAATLVESFGGRTWYVSARAATGGDGSQTAPFQSVQSAVNAAVAGDTVRIAAGVYDAGVRTHAVDGVQTRSRVVVDKRLRLQGDGRGATVLAGASATQPDADGLGSDAVRCLFLTDAAAGTLLEGLTLVGGRTDAPDVTQTTSSSSVPIVYAQGDSKTRIACSGVNTVAKGGGAWYASTETGHSVYLVDVDVDDCRAGYLGGGLCGDFVLIRSIVRECRGALYDSGAVAGIRGAFSSVFVGNGGKADGTANLYDTVIARRQPINDWTTFINCTMVLNRGQGVISKGVLDGGAYAPGKSTDGTLLWGFYNCAFFDANYRFTDAQGNFDTWNSVMNTNGSMPNNKNNIGGDWGAKYAGVQRWLGGVDCSTGLADSSAKIDAYGWNQLVSVQNNWRPREGAAILDQGSNDWITVKGAFIPEEYRAFDMDGRARIQNGRVDMGAYEGGAPQGRTYTLAGSWDGVRVNGHRYAKPVNGSANFYSGTPGEILTFEVDAQGGELFGLTTTNLTLVPHSTSYRNLYPNGREKKVTLVVGPAEGAQVTYTVQLATSVKWVDPVNGVDDSNHGTEAAPYRTLQYANDQSSAKGVVFAKPGQYAEGEGGSMTDGDWIKTTKCRLTINKALRICGLEGAERTFIMGRHSTDDSGFTNDGCGAGALRCVGFATGSADGAIQGFTLTGGATDSDPIGKWKASGKEKSSDNDQCYNWAGAGICGWSWPSGGQIHQQLFDCIISNNVAYFGTAALNVFAHRCIFTKNRTVNQANETNKAMAVIGRLTSSCAFSNCLFHDNDGITNSLIVPKNADWPVVNCTFGPTRSGLSPISSGSAHGCVFQNCGKLNNLSGSGNIVWPSVGNWSSASARIVVDPALLDTATRRFVPSVASPTATSAVWSDVCALAVVPFGLDGAPFAVRADGTYPAGCWQRLLSGAAATATADSGISPAGSVGVEEGESVTFTASDVATRNFLGFEVDGELVTGGTSYTWTPFSASDLLTVKAVYATDWYVNPDAAFTDQNTGWTPETAKHSLNAALALARAGDTVHAAPGRYEDNAVVHPQPISVSSTGYALPARAVIPSGVSLVADGDASNTAIVGRHDPTGADYPYQNLYLGPEGVRCVVMYEGARLSGFSLLEGGTRYTKDTATGTSVSGEDWRGAGVLAATGAQVTDCVLSNCFAAAAGGGFQGTYTRCRFLRCVAIDFGGGTFRASQENCFFDSCFDSPINEAALIRNCTIGSHCQLWFGSDRPGTMFNLASSGRIENTVVLSPSKNAYTFNNVYNCRFRSEMEGLYTLNPESSANVQFLALSDVGVNAEGRPLAGSTLIDAGDNARVAEGEDVMGGQRIYNGTVDIGAYEYDWRPDFARTLVAHGSRFTVMAADPQVVKVDNAVEVRDGALNIRWVMVGGSVAMGIDVRGDGTLSLFRGDELVETFTKASDKIYRLRSTAARGAPTDLRFVYAKADGDTEGALLSNFEDNNGTLVIFR